jgi:methionyl aminopeptidase
MKAFSPSKINESAAYAAAQCVVETHRRLSQFLAVGQTLPQIDRFVALTLSRLKCHSCFLNYRVPGSPPFPSHACLSVNHCVVHGTHDYYSQPMKEGDVLKIDIGVMHQGWIGDAAWTYVFGRPTDEVAKLCQSGKEGLARGIQAMQPGSPIREWAKAVQGCIEDEFGMHLVRNLGGHGYGRKLHTDPYISNVVPPRRGDWPDGDRHFKPGMLIAVEPMVAAGTGKPQMNPGTWPVYTGDGSQSVHYEHDVLITEDGPRVLTEGLEAIEDVILR